MKKLNLEHGKNIHAVHLQVLQAFKNHQWPGNIRELENLMERACILETTTVLTPESFPTGLFGSCNAHAVLPVHAHLTLADDPGKQILQHIFNASRDPDTGGRIAFVEDYGEQLSQYLIHGVDVWLNTPIPPMEASGTSGMKATLNGVPQLSIMDGRWLEGYNGKNGWAIDHQAVSGDRNRLDATELYRIFEEEVIPLYYDISEEGVPYGWVNIMKGAIKSNVAKFSARRMVKEYAEKFYKSALNSI